MLTLYRPWLSDVFMASIFSRSFGNVETKTKLWRKPATLDCNKWSLWKLGTHRVASTGYRFYIDSIDVLFPCDTCFDNWITTKINTNNETQHVNPNKLYVMVCSSIYSYNIQYITIILHMRYSYIIHFNIHFNILILSHTHIISISYFTYYTTVISPQSTVLIQTS